MHMTKWKKPVWKATHYMGPTLWHLEGKAWRQLKDSGCWGCGERGRGRVGCRGFVGQWNHPVGHRIDALKRLSKPTVQHKERIPIYIMDFGSSGWLISCNTLMQEFNHTGNCRGVTGSRGTLFFLLIFFPCKSKTAQKIKSIDFSKIYWERLHMYIIVLYNFRINPFGSHESTRQKMKRTGIALSWQMWAVRSKKSSDFSRSCSWYTAKQGLELRSSYSRSRAFFFPSRHSQTGKLVKVFYTF